METYTNDTIAYTLLATPCICLSCELINLAFVKTFHRKPNDQYKMIRIISIKTILPTLMIYGALSYF